MTRGRGKNAADRSDELVIADFSSITPPDSLLADGKELWTQTLQSLGPSCPLRFEDLPIFEAYCMTYQIMRSAQRIYNNEYEFGREFDRKCGDDTGEDWAIIETYQIGESSGRKMSTVVSIIFKSQDQMLKLASKLGFTPMARAQLKITNAAANSLGLDNFEKYKRIAENEYSHELKKARGER